MISNKKIWITGGGSGIGRELALQLAEQGNTVVISGRTAEKLHETAIIYAREGGGGGEIIPLPFDVSNDSLIAPVARQLKEYLGSLDIAILSAGTCEYVDNSTLDIGLFRRTFETNVFGVVNASSIALSLFQEEKEKEHGPQLVVISSLSTVTGLPRAEAYGASKAAVDYFCDSLAIDLQQQGVSVSLIQPGFIHTPMTVQNDFAMPFAMSADVAAKRIINAIDNRKRLYRFPLRLYWLIKLPSSIPWLWYSFFAPSLVRSNSPKV